jgi:hypothetical protein
MADKKKSILDEALMDAKRIQEALDANSKEILRSVTKEEIDSLVKESLEEDYLEEDVDDTEELETTADAETGDVEDVEGDDAEEVEDSEEEGEIEVGTSYDSEEGEDLEGTYDSGMDAVASDNEVEMDMTTASDDDVIAVYKKLTGDDSIEVVVDDEAGEVHLTVDEPGEYVIKTDEAGEVEGDEEIEVEPMGDMGDEAGEDVDEVMYEIALDEVAATNWEDANSNTDEDGEKGFKDKTAHANMEGEMVMSEENESLEEEAALTEEETNEEVNEESLEEGDEALEEDVAEGKEELEEQIPVGIAQEERTKGKKADIGQPRPRKVNESEVIAKYNTLLAESKELKGKNDEYKTALKQFRGMLAETVVFNSNLTYCTKLFMEHSTTKEEKENIFKRFDDEVSTLKESKKLYKSIDSELKNRKPLNESVENKIIKEVASGKSGQLNESTAYVDRETSRILDLMKRTNNR